MLCLSGLFEIYDFRLPTLDDLLLHSLKDCISNYKFEKYFYILYFVIQNNFILVWNFVCFLCCSVIKKNRQGKQSGNSVHIYEGNRHKGNMRDHHERRHSYLQRDENTYGQILAQKKKTISRNKLVSHVQCDANPLFYILRLQSVRTLLYEP